ncbi:hypothetical protein [uncultured Litoreibacter sp.]|uniref:hypothetical protein n=1 Tax=uncultured Litoreibacter sp. TaxID=1392394 RepID=UPI0026293229|nr:hypothetical protein [uncultured Litoreibacter sp.]
MSSSTKFHWLTHEGSRATKPVHDYVLCETKNFAVLPSLGSLVPNWVLIIPKNPMPCLSHLNLNEQNELTNLSERVRAKFSWSPAETFLFEHGGEYGSPISCGVDQAHLHLVNVDFDLILAAKNFNTELVWETEEGCLPMPSTSEQKKAEYLACSNAGIVHFAFPKSPVSQFFRRVIAQETSQPEKWNYRDFPALEEISNTNARFLA